jgi:hypothetical protein
LDNGWVNDFDLLINLVRKPESVNKYLQSISELSGFAACRAITAAEPGKPFEEMHRWLDEQMNNEDGHAIAFISALFGVFCGQVRSVPPVFRG